MIIVKNKLIFKMLNFKYYLTFKYTLLIRKIQDLLQMQQLLIIN